MRYYFTQKDIIDKRQKQDYLQQAQLQLLPKMEKKDIDKFFKELIRDINDEQSPASNVGKGTTTDFEALKRAKKQFK